MSDVRCQREIVELHQFIEHYFLGKVDSLERMSSVLGSDFSMVTPHGDKRDRAVTLDAMRAGFGHASSLSITTRDHRLVLESPELLVCEYVEAHELADHGNARQVTVVFSVDPQAPNGLVWRRVHETWAEAG